MHIVELTRVQSSQVSAVGLDDGGLGLVVVFRGNRAYAYPDGDFDTLQSMLEAESKGGFVNSVLKAMSSERLDADVKVGWSEDDGISIPVLDWTIEHVFERIRSAVEMSQDGSNAGKLDTEAGTDFIILPKDTPKDLIDALGAALADFGSDSDLSFAVGSKNRILTLCNAEFTLEVGEANEDEVDAEPVVIGKVTAVAPEVNEKVSGKGTNPRRRVGLTDRETKHYLQALMQASASFQKNIGLEPVAFLPYDAPDEVRAILEEAGFKLHRGNDLPPVGKVDVGVHIDQAS